MDMEGPRPGNQELSQPIAKQSPGKRGSATDRAKGAVQLTGHTTRLSATLCVFISMTVQQAELCYATQTDLSHFTKTPFQDRQVGEGGMADKRS